MGVDETAGDGGGEEFVPVGKAGGSQRSGVCMMSLFGGVDLLAPGVELPQRNGIPLGVGVQLCAEARFEQELPEGVACGDDDGRRRRVGIDDAVPVAQEVGGLVETLVL